MQVKGAEISFPILLGAGGEDHFLILLEVKSGRKVTFRMLLGIGRHLFSSYCWELVESRFSHVGSGHSFFSLGVGREFLPSVVALKKKTPPDSKIMRKCQVDFKIMGKLAFHEIFQNHNFGVFLFFYGTQSRLIYRQTQYELYYPPMFHDRKSGGTHFLDSQIMRK